MIPRVPDRELAGCDAADVARMRDLSRGYARFAGTTQIGDSRYFRFESAKQVLEVPVRVVT